MSEIKLFINGKECIGQMGQTILEIAEANGIDIPTLCHNENVKHYGACGVCVVEDKNSPKLMRSCSTHATDGMDINTESPRVVQARKIALELLMSDHDGDCRGPCMLNCPAGTDCQLYVKKIAEGDYTGAVETIKEKLPLPASIGRVCPHPCETACRRQMVEEPISIAFLKAFAADQDLASDNPFKADIAPATGKTVGIIGGGPAGLTAAYFLARDGHKVTIYEAMPNLGGMLRYGIPEYRLPKVVLDQEIAAIAAMGVEMKTNFKIGVNATFEEIRKTHDAVIVAIGAWKSMGIGCPGEELNGVWGGIHLLREIALGNRPNIGEKVAVVGGGNTAMDACRSAVRLGAKEVSIIYRRTLDEMPAEKIEIHEAMEEGVTFRFLRNPAEIIGEDGKVKAVKLQVMELGEPDASGRRSPVPVEGEFEILEVDSVIAAIGQKVLPEGFGDLELNRRGIIAADESTFRTNLEGVFAVGDATNRGAGIAIAAIGEANKAAMVVDTYLKGHEIPYRKPYYSERVVVPEMFAAYEKKQRAEMACKAPEIRIKDFNEMNLGFTEEQAKAEASRCLECGCHDYYDCSLIKYANRYEIHPERFEGQKRKSDSEKKLVVIERNQGKCILCGLCVRVCEEVAGQGLLGLVGRGFGTEVKPEFRDSEKIQMCRDCLKCAGACPTGALRIIS